MNNIKINKKDDISLSLIKQRVSAVEESNKGIIEDRLLFLMLDGYRVSDTKLTYRQINILGVSGLLNGDKNNSRGWRSFTFKDLVYLDILSELRKYGLDKNQLKKVKDFFYKKNTDINLVLVAVLLNIKITIALKSDGELDILEAITGSLSLDKEYRAVMVLNLNEFVNGVLERLGMEKIKYSTTLSIASELFTKKSN